MQIEGPKSKFLDLYYKMPIPIQNILFSIGGYRNKLLRYNSEFYEYLNFIKESEWWEEDQIKSYQEEQLIKIAKHSFNNVPFVKNQFKESNISVEDIKSLEDLKKIKIIGKNDLRDSKYDYYDVSIPKRKLLVSLTSGTSGRPLTLYSTRESNARQWAVWARHKERFGIRLGDKHLSFGARVPIKSSQSEPPFWRKNYASNQVYLSTFHLSEKFIPSILDFLNKEKFDYYLGYPSSMYVLAKYLEDNNLKLINRPKYVITGSDALLPHFEKTINRAFGVPVTEQYGMGEACGNLSKCEHGRFHLDFEFGIVELLDLPSHPNPNMKRLLFTSLANNVMPLFRYDIGDYGEYDATSCSCGRKTLSLISIEGRLEDYILTPDGRKVTGMNQVFEWANGIKEIQVYQKDKFEIQVRYIPDLKFTKSDINALEIEFRKRLGNQIKINYLEVSNISRSKTGKYKAVVSELNQLSYNETTHPVI